MTEEKTTEESTNEKNNFEEVVREAITTVGKYDVNSIIEKALQIKNDLALFDYVREHGKRIAIEIGVLENPEAKAERIKAEKAEKAEAKARVEDAIELIEELPEDSEGYTTLRDTLVNNTGATPAIVRMSLKELYEAQGIEVPKAVRKAATPKDPGFVGIKKAVADAVISNPNITEDELMAIVVEASKSNKESQHVKTVTFGLNLVVFAKQVLGEVDEVLAEAA